MTVNQNFKCLWVVCLGLCWCGGGAEEEKVHRNVRRWLKVFSKGPEAEDEKYEGRSPISHIDNVLKGGTIGVEVDMKGHIGKLEKLWGKVRKYFSKIKQLQKRSRPEDRELLDEWGSWDRGLDPRSKQPQPSRLLSPNSRPDPDILNSRPDPEREMLNSRPDTDILNSRPDPDILNSRPDPDILNSRPNPDPDREMFNSRPDPGNEMLGSRPDDDPDIVIFHSDSRSGDPDRKIVDPRWRDTMSDPDSEVVAVELMVDLN